MAHSRRQSGLWQKNAHTGIFEQVGLPPAAQIRPIGPYQYYEPPPRTEYEPPRHPFSDRAAANEPLLPAPNDVSRSESKRKRSDAAKEMASRAMAPMKDMLDQNPHATSEHFAQTKHINELQMPDTTQPLPALHIDPDYVPENLRTTWSPDVVSPKTQPVQIQTVPQRRPSQTQRPQRPRQTSNATSISETVRRGSVPDRSPLQNLESWSKEEKRARVEEAERRARQRSLAAQTEARLSRSDTARGEKDRAVGDGAARKPSQSERRNERPELSDPASPQAISSVEKFQTASDALRRQSLHSDQPFSLVQEAQKSSRQVTSDSSRDAQTNQPADPKTISTDPRASVELGRTKSGKYRARDAGFAGAAAAYTSGPTMSAVHNHAAERGKAAYERRKVSMRDSPADSPVSPISPEGDGPGFGLGRSLSKRLNKRSPQSDKHSPKQQLAQNRMGQGEKQALKAAAVILPPDPVAREDARGPPDRPVRYVIPPQTAAGQQARQQVGFAEGTTTSLLPNAAKHHHFNDFLHHNGQGPRSYEPSSQPLGDWRRAKAARLTVEDLDFEKTVAGASRNPEPESAWWEKRKRSSSNTSKAASNLSQIDGAYEEHATSFQPRLFLKCGPLLRYTGIRKETSASRGGLASEKEIWRGTIMIVTEDDQSDLASSPVLRLFAQDSDLHELPHPHLLKGGKVSPPEHEDPVAGQVKLSRTGRPLYVRPVQEIPGGLDLSREENNEGLFAATRTPVLGPQSVTGPDGRRSQHIAIQDKSRIKKRDGERAGRYRDAKAIRLHTERGFTFWRFSVEVELGSRQQRVAYRINNGPAIGFWVPAKGETMNIMFHSCNGFSMSVNSAEFTGPDPLWRDVLNRHQGRPFHVMIGGGDQIYNDAVEEHTELFKAWLHTKNPEHKYKPGFPYEMQDELEEYYLDRYSMWFSQGLFAMANSQIPMVNIWDDHDIIDGYGSYPKHFMSTGVFTGLGAVAFKYYMLFQHQSLTAETEKEEPSWLLGKSPGPYINQVSRNVFMSLGNKVALLGLDCRTERMRDEVLSQSTYDIVFDRCYKEIVKEQTKHLIVLLGVPIAYPRLNFLENMLTSRFMDPIKAIGRTGMLGGFVNKFDGGVEILDDLDDHWTAKHHKAERNYFIQELQELAAEKSVRITILGGDVHLGAVGQFYSNKKFGIPKDKDHRYMPNVISSAIVNTPPPAMLADVLNRRNKVHHLDEATDEDMIPMFSHDVDGTKRNNMRLLPRRNYCIIREYVPGSTPPSSPRLEPATPGSANFGGHETQDDKDRHYPPGSMKRTMSLTRGPVNLVRRLSGTSKNRTPPVSLPPEHIQPYNAADKQASILPQRANSISGPRPSGTFSPTDSAPERPVYTFHRRPTDLSIKEAKRAAAAAANGHHDGREPGHIDLEGGLDISLCVEVDQRDPSGITLPYRLLVPALWYDGSADINPEKFKSHRASLMSRLRFNRKREQPTDGHYDDYYSGTDGTRTPSPPPQDMSFQKETEQNTAANAMGLTNTGRGAPMLHRGSSLKDNNATPRRVVTDTTGAYTKGWNLSPPLHQSQHPDSAYSHVSATAQHHYAREEDSLTPSEEDVEDIRPQRSVTPERRGSKPERFLGIGDMASVAEDRGVEGDRLNREGSKRGKGWKIWSR